MSLLTRGLKLSKAKKYSKQIVQKSSIPFLIINLLYEVHD